MATWRVHGSSCQLLSTSGRCCTMSRFCMVAYIVQNRDHDRTSIEEIPCKSSALHTISMFMKQEKSESYPIALQLSGLHYPL